MPQEVRAVFSRIHALSELKHRKQEIVIVAEPKEREALAKQLGILGISNLEASFNSSAYGGDGVHLLGEVRAEIVQNCIVSLEPFAVKIIEPIDICFAPAQKLDLVNHQQTILDDPNIEDPPDPVFDGRIDLGVVASEFLALGLNPYPKKPGVDFVGYEIGENQPLPFADLKDKLAQKSVKKIT